MNVDRPRWFETRYRWIILAMIVLFVAWAFTVAIAEFRAASA